MVKVVGRVAPTSIEAFVLADGRTVTFHTAFIDKERTEQVTFCSDLNSWPSIKANALKIEYTFMRNATRQEAYEEIALAGWEVRKVIKL